VSVGALSDGRAWELVHSTGVPKDGERTSTATTEALEGLTLQPLCRSINAYMGPKM